MEYRLTCMSSKNSRGWLAFVCWMVLFTPALLEGFGLRALLLWVGAAFLFWPLTLCRPALALGMAGLLGLGAVNIVHVGFFGNLADQLLIATALRTNWEEAREFMGVLPWPWVALAALWAVVGGFAAAYVWRFAGGPAKASPFLRKLSWAGVAIWSVFLVFVLVKRYDFDEVIRKLKTIYPMHIVRAWTAQQQLTDSLFYTPQLPDAAPQAAQIDTLVVVIGESASAQRWSMLGYQGADTNGALAQLQGVQVARAMAHGLNTAAALPYLLTGMAAQDSVAHRAPSFLDIARQAGYKTFVVSNSRYHSAVEDFYGVTFRRAADVFVKAGNGEWDEVLTPHLEAALQDPAPHKLVVLHTYGSHFQVEERYPTTAAHFPDAYDNSLRYSSDLLAQWIQAVERSAGMQKTALLLYSSDHGVAMPPCADQYRTGSGLSSLQVPLLSWSNAALRARLPQLVPEFAATEREQLSRSNAAVADIAVSALGYPDALTALAGPQGRQLTFHEHDWPALQKLDACSLQ